MEPPEPPSLAPVGRAIRQGPLGRRAPSERAWAFAERGTDVGICGPWWTVRSAGTGGRPVRRGSGSSRPRRSPRPLGSPPRSGGVLAWVGGERSGRGGWATEFSLRGPGAGGGVSNTMGLGPEGLLSRVKGKDDGILSRWGLGSPCDQPLTAAYGRPYGLDLLGGRSLSHPGLSADRHAPGPLQFRPRASGLQWSGNSVRQERLFELGPRLVVQGSLRSRQ